MSGERYFLDTNAVVQLLAGNEKLKELLADAEYIATSVVCELEFLAFPDLSENDAALLKRLLNRIEVIDVTHDDQHFKDETIRLRAAKTLRLPDAIIAASANQNSCTLLTADQVLLNCPQVQTQSYKLC